MSPSERCMSTLECGRCQQLMRWFRLEWLLPHAVCGRHRKDNLTDKNVLIKKQKLWQCHELGIHLIKKHKIHVLTFPLYDHWHFLCLKTLKPTQIYKCFHYTFLFAVFSPFCCEINDIKQCFFIYLLCFPWRYQNKQGMIIDLPWPSDLQWWCCACWSPSPPRGLSFR